MPLNPYTATRREFTADLVNAPSPADADPRWTALSSTLRQLLQALAAHPAMAENLDQTYMTPAKRKNKVYFMWDFVGRTLGQLGLVDPKLPARQGAAWDEVRGRARHAAMLMTDQVDMLEMMCANDRGGVKVEFTPEMGELARRIKSDDGA